MGNNGPIIAHYNLETDACFLKLLGYKMAFVKTPKR